MSKRFTKKQSFTAEDSTLTRTNLNPQLRILKPSGLPRPIVLDTALSQPAHLRRAASEPFPLRTDVEHSNGSQAMLHRRKTSLADSSCDTTVESVPNSPTSVVSQTSKSSIPRHFRTFLRRSSSSSSSSLSSQTSSPQISPEHAFVSSGIHSNGKHNGRTLSDASIGSAHHTDDFNSRIPRRAGNQTDDSGFAQSPTLDTLKSCLRGTLANDEQARARRTSLPSSPSKIPVSTAIKETRRGHQRSVSFALEDERAAVDIMHTPTFDDRPVANTGEPGSSTHTGLDDSASVSMYLTQQEHEMIAAGTKSIGISSRQMQDASHATDVATPSKPHEVSGPLLQPGPTEANSSAATQATLKVEETSDRSQHRSLHRAILPRPHRSAATSDATSVQQLAAAAVFVKFELVLGLTLAAVWLVIGRILGDKPRRQSNIK